MYVRSPAWSYWRSHSYDFYTGERWMQSDDSLTLIPGRGGIAFPVPVNEQALGEEIVQSFYIVRDQPNLIFVAYRPVIVYLRAEQIGVDAGDGLRAGEPLRAGLVYTVVSRRPVFEAERLRAAAGEYPPEIAARYLQLPDNVSLRVRDLARTLTMDAPTAYDKAVVIRDYLLQFPYDFFPPPHKPGAEVVDTFLFEDRRGICEMYASAHVVLLRALGIPARLVAGYGAGEYNALSGYYTVRLNNAHAWAEVYFPGYGWVPFDPTPGWTPSPYTAPVQRWVFSGAFEGLAVPLGEAASAGLAALSLVIGPLASATAVVGGAALILWLARWWWRRWRGARRTSTLLDADASRRRILAAYRTAQRRLRRARAPAETPLEFARRLNRPELDELTGAVEIAAYRPEPPAPALAERAKSVLKRLR
jgi:transglutaminase-like putative cysteine protease